jgi:hypothetical protein
LPIARLICAARIEAAQLLCPSWVLPLVTPVQQPWFVASGGVLPADLKALATVISAQPVSAQSPQHGSSQAAKSTGVCPFLPHTSCLAWLEFHFETLPKLQ